MYVCMYLYKDATAWLPQLDEKKKRRKFASPIILSLDKKKKKRKFASPAA